MKRILIVDDEKSIAFFLGENLLNAGAGYQVTIAHSGEEALSKIALEPFDLMVTDLRLPGLSGLELARSVRQASPQTRIILITGHGSEQAQKEADRLNVSSYITKPFRMEQFIYAAEQALFPAGV